MLAAHQPQYLPYLGLLDKIAAADVFVLQDDLQFSRSSFQNRNRIRTSDSRPVVDDPGARTWPAAAQSRHACR